MGTCATKTQRELTYSGPIIPSIIDYEPTRRETPLKTNKTRRRGLSTERTNSIQQHSNMDKKQPEFIYYYHTEQPQPQQFKFMSRDRTLLRQKFKDYQNCTISSCRSLKRIILLFKYYKFLETNFSNNLNLLHHKLLEFFDTKYFHLINDYHHIINRHLNNHSNNIKENNNEYQLLYNEITKYITCHDILKCQHFARNNGYILISDDNEENEMEGIIFDEEKDKEYGNFDYDKDYKSPTLDSLTMDSSSFIDDDEDEEIAMDSILPISFYLDILDSIHCFFIHSFDDGHRINLNEIQIEDDDIINTSDDLLKLFHDSQIEEIKTYLKSKNKLIHHINGNRIQINKFHTNYPGMLLFSTLHCKNHLCL